MPLKMTRRDLARIGKAGKVGKRRKPAPQTVCTDHAWIAAQNAEPGIFIPVRTRAQGNQYRHWRVESREANEQKAMVLAALTPVKWQLPSTFPLRVTFTRYGAGTLDRFGNLPSAFKHIMDALAAFCGVDDKDPRWIYAEPQQVKTRAGQFGVRIVIESTAPYGHCSGCAASKRGRVATHQMGTVEHPETPSPAQAGGVKDEC